MRSYLLCLWFVTLSPSILAQLRWVELGKMQQPRTTARSERMSNSSIIVMGGWTQWPATTATTDIIDVERRSVVAGPEMLVARADFASVTMPSGLVAVFGGYTDGYEKNTDVVEVLDPSSGKFRVSGHLSMARGQLSALVLDSESVLLVGGRVGWSDVTNRCEIFYPRFGATRVLPSFPYATSHTQLIRTKEDRILAFSGRSGGPESYRSALIHEFDRNTEQWIVVGTVADSVWLPTITELPAREYLWSGGSYREANGPQDFTNTIGRLEGTTFRKVGSLVVDRIWHGGVSLSESMVIIVGGQKEEGGALRSCEFVDPRNGASILGPACLVAHGKACVAGVDIFGRRTAVVAGGESEAGTTDVVEMLVDDCINGSTTSKLDSSRVTLHGAARFYGSNVAIAGSDTLSAGSIWLKGKVSYDNGFTSTFVFRLSEGDDHQSPDGGSVGADGIAMVMQLEVPALTGGVGLGIGYDGLPHGLAIEFDTYRNSAANDPDGDHVAVQVGNGFYLSSQHAAPFLKFLATEHVPRFVADGRKYYARVQYGEGMLRVWVDRTGAFENPAVEVPFDLGSVFPNSNDRAAYVGLTSATGFASQLHEVEEWSITACRPILVGVAEQEKKDGGSGFLKVYRTGDELIVQAQEGEVINEWVIFDQLGRKLLGDRANTYLTHVRIDDLPHGVYYFVAVFSSNKTISAKFYK